MRHHPLSLIICTLGLPLLSGCFHMFGPYGGYPGNYYGTPPYGSPSGYGGYGGYPAYQGAPIQTLTPGQEYYPSPGSSSPSTTPPTFQDGGTSPLQPLNNGTNAPNYSPDGKTQPVPDPYFSNPQSTYSPPAQPEFEEASLQPAGHRAEALPSIDGLREVRGNPIGLPETVEADPIPSAQPRQLPDSVPADPMSSTYFPAHQPAPEPKAEPAPVASELQFEAPIPARELPEFNLPAEPPASMPEPETTAPRQAPAMPADADPFFGSFNSRRVSPFAYDAKYRWLQGIVSREEDGSWSMIYSDNPHPNDQLAGQITLARSPLLTQLQDGDVVQVDGQVDPVSRDRLGKAVYLVTGLKKVPGH